MGSSSACIDTPLAAQEQRGVAGREVTGVCLLVAWQYTFSSFFTQQKTVPLFFSAATVISQTKEAQTESVICFLWILFLFLSQSSSVEAAQATSSSSVFCHGKKN